MSQPDGPELRGRRGGDRRGVPEHQPGQDRGLIGRQHPSGRGGEPRAHRLRGALQDPRAPPCRFADGGQHRHGEVPAGGPADPGAESHRLTGDEIAETGRGREHQHLPGAVVITEAVQGGPEHQPAVAQRARALPRCHRHPRRAAESVRNGVVANGVAAQADGETEPGADDGQADHPGAPGPQQAAAGGPGRQQPDGATRQECDGDARPDRPDDACRRHRPGRERGRHQPQIQRGVGPHGSDPDQVA